MKNKLLKNITKSFLALGAFAGLGAVLGTTIVSTNSQNIVETKSIQTNGELVVTSASTLEIDSADDTKLKYGTATVTLEDTTTATETLTAIDAKLRLKEDGTDVVLGTATIDESNMTIPAAVSGVTTFVIDAGTLDITEDYKAGVEYFLELEVVSYDGTGATGSATGTAAMNNATTLEALKVTENTTFATPADETSAVIALDFSLSTDYNLTESDLTNKDNYTILIKDQSVTDGTPENATFEVNSNYVDYSEKDTSTSYIVVSSLTKEKTYDVLINFGSLDDVREQIILTTITTETTVTAPTIEYNGTLETDKMSGSIVFTIKETNLVLSDTANFKVYIAGTELEEATAIADEKYTITVAANTITVEFQSATAFEAADVKVEAELPYLNDGTIKVFDTATAADTNEIDAITFVNLSSTGLSTGALIGIIVGVVAAVAILAGLGY